nr:hypothetical protein [Patescibacteria group bacterium]
HYTVAKRKISDYPRENSFGEFSSMNLSDLEMPQIYDVDFYYKRSIFGSFENLVKCASRREYKDSLVDYQDIDHSNRDKVVEFIKLYEQIDNETNNTQVNQDEYQSKKNRAAGLGEEILGDYDVYKLYLKQMGLTRETVEEIHAELKKELQTSSPLESEVSRKIREETSGKIKDMQEWNERITEELLSLKNENLKGTHKVISNPIKGKLERKIGLSQFLEKEESKKTIKEISDQIRRIQDWKNIYITEMNTFPQNEPPKETNKSSSDRIKGIQEWNERAMEVLRSLKDENLNKGTQELENDCIKETTPYREIPSELSSSQQDTDINTTKGIISQNRNNYLIAGNGYKRRRLRRYRW